MTRTLAGDLRIARAAVHYFLALLWAKAEDAVTVAAAFLFIITPTALLGYALFR